jgi:two-component system response regulator FixJ
MPGMTGLELVARLKQLGVTLPVIVLTGHADVAMAVEAMKAGVVDFIEKPFDDAALLAAVANARQHLQGEAGRQAEREDIEGRIAQLTGREKDVFEAIVTGESNKSAALKLGISPRTVEIYRANVMEKMRARTLSDLVRMALLRKST